MTVKWALALFIALLIASDTVRASGPAAGCVKMCANVRVHVQ